MKRLIPIFSIALIAVFLFASCKKDSSSSNGSSSYIKAKLNGEQKEFTTGVSATRSGLGMGLWTMIVGGASGTESFTINLWSDGDNFGTGTSFEAEATAASTYNSLGFVSPLGTSDPANIWATISTGTAATPELHVTITEANDKFIKGTFSGKIYQLVDNGASSMDVTEGEFYVKY